MTHAEALYTYNTYISMGEFIDGMSLALAAGCLDVEEIPQLVDLHVQAGAKALEACRTFGWDDLGAAVEKSVETQNRVVRLLRKDLERWERQKRR